MSDKESAFGVFEDISPRKQDKNIQVLYEYEKHYMELIGKYSEEISFVETQLKDYRAEQTAFYKDDMPAILEKLNSNPVDEGIKREWLRRLADNMDRSFTISEKVLTNYTTKKLDEFKAEVNKRLHEVDG